MVPACSPGLVRLLLSVAAVFVSAQTRARLRQGYAVPELRLGSALPRLRVGAIDFLSIAVVADFKVKCRTELS